MARRDGDVRRIRRIVLVFLTHEAGVRKRPALLFWLIDLPGYHISSKLHLATS